MVLSELAERIDPAGLHTLAEARKSPEVQRLGFLLDQAGQSRLADALLRALAARRYRPVLLARDMPRGDAVPAAPWRVIPNVGDRARSVIPRANITAWRAQAPWALDEQVEQDLVLSRALSEIFARPALREMLAFRGGTALHKLFFDPPGRYSEDLDLVQVTAGPIKPVLLEVQEALDGWLGPPRSSRLPIA